MRIPIVAGNWKMNKTVAEAVDLAMGVVRASSGLEGVEVVLCPPFTALAATGEAIRSAHLRLGAQNVHDQPGGAYTGEISVSMLSDLSCRYVIVGHSERRTYFGETDEGVNRKVRAVLDAGLRPIVCVGETLEQRERERTENVVREQISVGLRDLGPRLLDAVVAYEPVWAIGTGRTATAEQVQAVHELIRRTLAATAGSDVADAVRIQYGGSVKPSNAAELFGQSDVDGGLIGGASLDAESFVAIVRAARPD